MNDVRRVRSRCCVILKSVLRELHVQAHARRGRMTDDEASRARRVRRADHSASRGRFVQEKAKKRREARENGMQ
jgi:hypothetical protein